MGSARLGVDVGGTFTDVVALVDGRVLTGKVPSSPHSAAGVLDAVAGTGVSPRDVAYFAHGTTVATNALLERRGARTALVTTEGFRDIIEIGRQNRPSLYDLTADRPPALVPREHRFTVRERMGPDGELIPLDERGIAAIAHDIESADVAAVAVCFLFSFIHPEHELRAAEILRSALPDLTVVASSESLPEFREYERFSSTVADAYLGPRLSGYLGSLVTETLGKGLPIPVVMQSSGGVIDAERAATRAASCVLSGPAAGAIGAALVAKASGYRDALSFDMGGTSTDVAPILGGRVASTTEGEIAGVPLRFPMSDVHTVGAGGGSIAFGDDGGALHVGPRSAGADPGPVCYGRGGTEPTVTDANAVLGFLDEKAVLGGSIELDLESARTAIARLGEELGLDPIATARGIVSVVEAEMVRALRVISVQRGIDPRGMALVAFGGAGPLHACGLAEELGMTTVLVPRAGGVLSALGLAVADTRRDYVAPLRARLTEISDDDLAGAFGALEESAAADLDEPRIERLADLRYRGQAFELTVSGDRTADLSTAFHAAHEARYGYRMDDPIEIVAVRVIATTPGVQLDLLEPPGGNAGAATRRVAYLADQPEEIDVFDRDSLGAGDEISGPSIVEFSEATCLVRAGWGGKIDKVGTLVLERT